MTWTTYFDYIVIHLHGEIRLILRARLEANIREVGFDPLP